MRRCNGFPNAGCKTGNKQNVALGNKQRMMQRARQQCMNKAV